MTNEMEYAGEAVGIWRRSWDESRNSCIIILFDAILRKDIILK